MRRFLTHCVVGTVLLTAALVAAGAGRAVAQDEGLPLGASPAPPVLETLEGEPVDLREWVGRKPVVVEFWATWCTICRALEPRLRAAYEHYGDGVEFLIISAAVAQTRDQVRAHVARHPMPGRVLWDVEGRGTRAFEAPGTGYILILDADGNVAYTGTGVEQDILGALQAVVGEK